MRSLLSTKQRFFVMLSLMTVLLPGRACLAREPDVQQLIGRRQRPIPIHRRLHLPIG